MPMIHNRGKKIGDKTVARKIIFPQSWDENGNPTRDGKTVLSETLMPGEHKKVTDEQLKHLKDLFPDEILNLDDLSDLQAQFKQPEAAKPRPGYVAPEDVDSIVAKRVADELAKVQAGPEKPAKVETHEELVARIDAMNKLDLIALIDSEELDIDHKSLKVPELKGAILTAIENKQAAKAAA